MVGSAIYRSLLRRGFERSSILTVPRSTVDLACQDDVNQFLSYHKPDTVILAAATVGGIHANRTLPYAFLSQNLSIQSNIFNSCLENNIKNICFLGSSCMYPVSAQQPFHESDILTGPFEPTNEAYGLAKVSGLRSCQYLRRQHGFNSFTVIPNNSYGINDKYSTNSSHVIPSIIRKLDHAIKNGDPTVECWGTGNPRRNFIFVDDLADVILRLLDYQTHDKQYDVYNIASNHEISIYDLVHLIASKLDFHGEIVWDTSRPDGMIRKTLDITRIFELGIELTTDLSSGLDIAINDYKLRH